MLQDQSVPSHTLELLKLISPRLSELGFHLAGGTALALRLGHRISVDLDFFKSGEFSPLEVMEEVEALTRASSKMIQQSEYSVAFIHQDTKVELLRYDYPLLEPIDHLDGVSLVSLADKAAMKLSALAGRGSKKDFVDLAALLEEVDLEQLLSWYEQKFPQSESFVVMKSLTWFEDADAEPDPVFLKGQSWSEVKKTVLDAIR